MLSNLIKIECSHIFQGHTTFSHWAGCILRICPETATAQIGIMLRRYIAFSIHKRVCSLPTLQTTLHSSYLYKKGVNCCQFPAYNSTCTPQSDIKAALAQVDTSFTDASGTAFRCKTKQELRRALTVLWLCSFETLVKNNQKVSYQNYKFQ